MQEAVSGIQKYYLVRFWEKEALPVFGTESVKLDNSKKDLLL